MSLLLLKRLVILCRIQILPGNVQRRKYEFQIYY